MRRVGLAVALAAAAALASCGRTAAAPERGDDRPAPLRVEHVGCACHPAEEPAQPH